MAGQSWLADVEEKKERRSVEVQKHARAIKAGLPRILRSGVRRHNTASELSALVGLGPRITMSHPLYLRVVASSMGVCCCVLHLPMPCFLAMQPTFTNSALIAVCDPLNFQRISVTCERDRSVFLEARSFDFRTGSFWGQSAAR